MLKKIFNKKIIFFVLLLVIGYFGFSYYKKNQQAKQEPSYQITKVKKDNLSLVVSGSGQIYAESQVDIKAPISGDGLEVIEVKTKNNSPIKKDDIIAILDAKETEDNIQSAKYDLESAKNNHEKAKIQYSSQTERDALNRKTTRLDREKKELALKEAYAKLEDYIIKSPIDGIITGLDIAPGDSVTKEDIIASIITQEKYALISLNEVDAVKVKVGDTVQLTFDAIEDLIIEGEIEKINTIGKTAQGVVTYDAKIKLKNQNEKLKIGMNTSAEILIEKKENILVINNTAIKTCQQNNKISCITLINFKQSTPEENRNVRTSNNSDELSSMENLGNKSSSVNTQGDNEQKLTSELDSSQSNKNKRGGILIVKKNTVETQEIPVELGITDDIKTEIKQGLNEGDFILLQEISSNTSQSSGSTTNRQPSILPMGSGSGTRMR